MTTAVMNPLSIGDDCVGCTDGGGAGVVLLGVSLVEDGTVVVVDVLSVVVVGTTYVVGAPGQVR